MYTLKATNGSLCVLVDGWIGWFIKNASLYWTVLVFDGAIKRVSADNELFLSLFGSFWLLSKVLTFVGEESRFIFPEVINFVEISVDFNFIIFTGDISWRTLFVEGFFVGEFKEEEFEIETDVVDAVNIVDFVLEVELLFKFKSKVVVCGNNFDEGSVSVHRSDFDDSEVIKSLVGEAETLCGFSIPS